MRLMAMISLLLGCSASVSLYAFAAGPASSRPKLAAHDWSVNASPNLAKNPPSKRDLETFVAAIEDSLTAGGSSLGVEGGTYICSFQFADFRHDGFFSLFAGIGVVDRPSCGDLEVIDKTASGFELYQSGGSGAGADIPANIKDLRHDGNMEFLLHDGLGEIPQRCIADWTYIFAWTGDNYTNVSARFKDFYRERLESLNQIIPVLQPVAGPDGYSSSAKECLEAEAAAIQRFVGDSRDAGFDQAVRLATSKDSAERDFATELLGEFGTPPARKYLETLVKDSDNKVAGDAKYALSRSANGPMKIAPDSFQRAGSVAKF